MPSGRFAANGAWLAVQVMAHNLARWTARIGLGEQIATTKTLRRAVLLPGRTAHPLGTPPHPAAATAVALGNPVQSRPGTAASDSTPSLTAPVRTDGAQPNVPGLAPVRAEHLVAGLSSGPAPSRPTLHTSPAVDELVASTSG